ncbi:permease prefix domain 1-containing protein [Agromyces sp. G08B096]|uniref:Permease prefix domain 1-containing protein n=1 Tax=Agromyces sp. G08B096 TaxID=3156399 RepID=A0AAU7W581_9MICO
MTDATQQTPGTDDLEALIGSWRAWMLRRDAVTEADVDELEGHLRDRVDDLSARGLSGDEAFLVAVKRLGRIDDLAREYAREHSERLWKQLVLGDAPANGGPRVGGSAGTGSAPRPRRATGLAVALGLGVGAGLAIKAPSLAGLDLASDPSFFLRNAVLLVLPFLAAYFAWQRRLALVPAAVVAGSFVLAAVVLNAFPFDPMGATEVLASIHAAVALWLVTGLAYSGGEWRGERPRMDFVRFSGEWFVYFVLLALGGGALSGLTIAVFAAIGVDVSWFVLDWVLPCGAAGAVLVAAWLVEAKQRVIENIAPVLTKVFTPLVTVMMLALIVAALVQWNLVDASRDLLIAFDLVLIVVVALLVYSISARDPLAAPGWFDRLQVLMLASALVVDVVVLIAMIGRTGEFGFSANKTASLGLNLILAANLARALWLQLGFVRGRRGFGAVERWQMSYLPVYLAWAAIVVLAFPPVFDFA